MIIRVIPETEDEIANLQEVEYSGVEDYLIFGRKENTDNQEYDEFHNWRGNIRFLMANSQYYYELLNDERRNNVNNVKKKRPMIKKFQTGGLKLIDENANNDPNDPIEVCAQEIVDDEIEDVLPKPGFELK